MTETIAKILDFWFGPLDEAGMSAPEQHALWFKSSAETDQYCRDHFSEAVLAALSGSLDHWAESDRGLIALIILLDQFTRNIFRGTAQAFSGDAKALELAQTAIATGHHQRLPAIHQVFLYLPLEHCESLEVQEECVELFSELTAITGSEEMAGFRRYAVAHQRVIEEFGRFPHRNAVLGRPSTREELDHLATHGGF